MGQGLSREVGTQFRRVRPELRSFAPRLYAKGRTPPGTLLAPASRGAPLNWRASAQNRCALTGH